MCLMIYKSHKSSSPQQSERRNPCPRMQSVTERDFASAKCRDATYIVTPGDHIERFRFEVGVMALRKNFRLGKDSGPRTLGRLSTDRRRRQDDFGQNRLHQRICLKSTNFILTYDHPIADFPQVQHLT